MFKAKCSRQPVVIYNISLKAMKDVRKKVKLFTNVRVLIHSFVTDML